ncbi:MAG: methyltransferase domain-containing protein [Solirubrobacteraceae bacterium]
MHVAARQRILATLPDDALVLDVGGWAVPFPRADWMLDLGSYATRGTWGYEGDREAERFTEARWVQRDICDREPWPFADDQFDFAICSHTLEDVRDPVWVCAELARVARAGYIEVPSRLEEQTWALQGAWTGWSHHHWLIDVDQAAARIDFLFKSHAVHAQPNRFPAGFRESLSDVDRIQSLWWEDTFAARERILFTAEELDGDLSGFVAAHAPPPAPPRARWRAAISRLTR